MAIAIDKTSARGDVAASGTSNSLSFATLPAVGSNVFAIIAGADYGAGAAFITGVSDNQGNTYSLLSLNPDGTHRGGAYIAYAHNVASSGTFTVTATSPNNPGNIYFVWGLVSFTGLATSSSLDQSASKQDPQIGSYTSLSITTGTTTVADELVLAVGVGDVGSINIHAVQNAAGYTNLFLQNDANTYYGMRADYKIVAATGTQNTNWGFDALSQDAGLIATFKIASAAATKKHLCLLGVG